MESRLEVFKNKSLETAEVDSLPACPLLGKILLVLHLYKILGVTIYGNRKNYVFERAEVGLLWEP